MAESVGKRIISKRFERPDERRDFKGHGFMDVLTFESGTSIGRGQFQPGWRWSSDVKPIAGTDSCEVTHSGFCLKGKMVIRMNGGEEFRIQAGDAFEIPPGHDAWVEGNEACELIDVGGAAHYATGMRQTASEEKLFSIPRTLVEGFNKRDMNMTLSMLSDQVEWMDIASQTLFRGKEGYRRFDEAWLKAFPDGQAEIINIIAHGDRVVVEYVGRGTHLGPLEGPMGVLQATGKQVQLPMVDVMRIQDGKIIRGRTYYNAATVLQQVGVGEEPGAKAA